MTHIVAAVLALISGVLLSQDLIISKNAMISINIKALGAMKKTYLVGTILAIVGVAGWVTYAILNDSQTASTKSISWVLIFAGGFAVGLAVQLFLINRLLRLGLSEFFAILSSSGVLITLAAIVFVATAHYSSIVAVILAVGLIYGVFMVEFSILLTKFLTWFSSRDPNPEPGRNPTDTHPRVLARIGLLFLIVAGIIELVDSLV